MAAPCIRFRGRRGYRNGPVEAQACGTRAIASGRRGATESVLGLGHETPTGVCFDRQDGSAIVEAVGNLVKNESPILPVQCRENAMRFSPEAFDQKIRTMVEAGCAASTVREIAGTCIWNWLRDVSLGSKRVACRTLIFWDCDDLEPAWIGALEGGAARILYP